MDSSDNLCLVCHELVEVYAIGKCDHPICFKCSTRMRALCEQFYCPICRTDLPEVFFLTTRERYNDMPVKKFVLNRKLKIQFENNNVRDMFEELLEHRCKLCPKSHPEKSFRALKEHMRRVHTLFYCDLCLELKIFTSHRKVYNRQDLAIHRRVGDKDDKSYKGHPLCQFCEERFQDKDELYKHLRKQHFFCHFCESLGSQEFYDDYESLKQHFHNDHYLCEEGECVNVQFTNVFRTDIDLRSHMAQNHSKAQGKAQARQERTLNIDINLVPRPGARGNRGGRDEYEGQRRGGARQSGTTGGRDEYEGQRRGGARQPGNPGGRDDYDGQRRGGARQPGGHGTGPTNKGGNKYTPPNARERMDIDRAIQASLSTMSNEDMKKDKKPVVVDSSSSDDDFAQSDKHFPSLHSSAATTSQTTGTSTVTAATSNTTTTVTESSANKPTLADRFAMASNRTVQHGSMNDFPSLSQTIVRPESSTTPSVNNGVKVKALGKPLAKREDDFPELPTAKKTVTPSSNTNWTKPSKPTEENKPKNRRSENPKTKYDENDFPTLAAPANTASFKWFKPMNKPVTSKTKNLNNSDEAPSGIDIRDRFSPVNVPMDTVADSKAKNKKKKKKERVNDIKDNKEHLKGNASLDDIASLLMPTTVSKDKPVEVVVQEPKVTVTEKVAKKKEDKVEKKLESKRIEPKVEEVKEINDIEKAFNYEYEPPADFPASKPVKFGIADDEDFPALCGGKKQKPPPGFRAGTSSAAPTTAKPPPGLSSGQNSFRPPPGFMSSKLDETKFTSSDPAPVTNGSSADHDFSQPEDFSYRNQMLIGTIQSICGEDGNQFSDFKKLSGEFRRGDLDAGQYYIQCENVLGKKNFGEVFPELLALLPDIQKQNDLLSVHMEEMKRDAGVLKISGKSRDMKGAWTPSNSGFLTCQNCRQVLVRRDYNKHLAGHSIQSDFPALSTEPGSGNRGMPSGRWMKANH
ncbi:E3 ubiquitin-protein ligase ZNF598-like [Mya arenaria]|uniref:E3 ubiquitin-protein ligase ZNF598-like n=1 Tax=Mya arenaria TaxID=6604 RepID=UPI0022E2FFB7|nr:E3 ubiquitin-protein ligase ZNF598-like [Mya arenaria]